MPLSVVSLCPLVIPPSKSPSAPSPPAPPSSPPTLSCAVSIYPSHTIYLPTKKGALRHGETGGVCCRHGNPPFPHIRHPSDIIWLAAPGLWKEAHTVLSERRRQQERERATRGEPVKKGGSFFFKSAGASD